MDGTARACVGVRVRRPERTTAHDRPRCVRLHHRDQLQRHIPTLPARRARHVRAHFGVGTLALLGAAALIAGCGGSGGSSTITLGNESKADEALATTGAPASPTSTTATAAAKTQIRRAAGRA